MFSSPVIDPGAQQPAEIMLGSTPRADVHRALRRRARGASTSTSTRRARAGAALRLIYPLALRAPSSTTAPAAGPRRCADIEESMRLVEETGYDLLLAGHPLAVSALIEMDAGRFDDARAPRRGVARDGRAQRRAHDQAVGVLGARAARAARRATPPRPPSTCCACRASRARDQVGRAEHRRSSTATSARRSSPPGDLDEARAQAARMRARGRGAGPLVPARPPRRGPRALLADDDAFEARVRAARPSCSSTSPLAARARADRPAARRHAPPGRARSTRRASRCSAALEVVRAARRDAVGGARARGAARWPARARPRPPAATRPRR